MGKKAFLAIGFVAALSASASAWTGEAYISSGLSGGTGQPAMAFDALNRLHVVFSTNPNRLYYRMFDGVTWSAPVDLPGPNYKEPQCSIAVDRNGVLHVVGMYRVDNTISTPYTIYYWSYNGATWTGPTMLSSGQGDDSNSCNTPGVAVDMNNDVHAIWSESGEIMYRKKQAGAWQAVQNLTNNAKGTSYGSVSPWIAVDKNGNTVHVVWHDDFLNNGFQAYYTKNTSLGASASWLPKSQWFQLSTGDYGKDPTVVLDASNNPHVFWTDRFGGSTNVLGYRRWTGTGWTNAVSWGSLSIGGAAFDATGLMRFVSIADNGAGTLEAYHRTYNVATGQFSAPEQVSVGTNTLKVDYAMMAIDYFGNSNIVWEERKGEWPGVGGFYYNAQAYPQRPDIGPSGTLAGVVRDQYGAGIAGVRVGTAQGYQAVTTATGSYSVTLPVGAQTVTATKDFYDSQTVNVSIPLNQTLTQNFVLTGQSPEPMVFTVQQGNRMNQLSWTLPPSANVSGLVIRCSTAGYPATPNDGTPVLDVTAAAGASGSWNHNGLTNGVKLYYTAFAYAAGASRYYSTPTQAVGTPAGPADMDRDGDVDQADWGAMQLCLSGPYIPQNDPNCARSLFDGDTDVDTADADLFTTCMSGPGIASNPVCVP